MLKTWSCRIIPNSSAFHLPSSGEMGCAASRIDEEERVRICKERKMLMKILLRYREEFANAQLAYLRSLKNTGVTLRQFTESDSLELEDPTSVPALPPSPPTPLPSSPPPPPPVPPAFMRKFEDKQPNVEVGRGEIIEVDEESTHTQQPLVWAGEYWENVIMGNIASSSLECDKKCDTVEEENWEDTNTEFLEEDDEEAVVTTVDDIMPRKQHIVELVDDDSFVMSCNSNDTSDKAMVVWRSNKTLTGIVKDLDDYFVKAAGGVKNIAVFVDISMGDTFLFRGIKENKRNRSSSAKVFSSLTWSWYSKSFRSTRETGEVYVSGEPCKPGAHCITLQKLYLEEQKIYKAVKEEESAKVGHQRKSSLLGKLEEEHNLAKSEKTRSAVESLQSYILSLQQSISQSYETILRLISEELHPQLIALSSGLMHLWQTMYDCHQVQNHISQQLNHIENRQNTEFSSEYHREAAAQLKTEVTYWYNSFCKLVKYQKEYVGALCKWTECTDCFRDVDGCGNTSMVHSHALAEEWLLALDKLPDKMVSEAIKSLLSAIHTIVLQQHEEVNLRKRSDKLGRKLERELTSLSEAEMKFDCSLSTEDTNSALTSKNLLLIRRAKVEALKRLVDDEKAKYGKSVQTTQTMILNNLRTSLPNVFQALMVYSNAYAQSFEVILSSESIVGHDCTQPATFISA
ncbi:Hypothetical predicted protein [Olea europaea subsp. europaea]|uniref:DUF632 domain-containing protein n=1 Tax=Olea europaea subsp. europaea TaxID=158383 RepID=A0A8S0RLT2_OLEEU|nr:Hypothetical predicted protein [Olea europaea subsp. europaea]